jgi:hypothetical protein
VQLSQFLDPATRQLTDASLPKFTRFLSRLTDASQRSKALRIVAQFKSQIGLRAFIDSKGLLVLCAFLKEYLTADSVTPDSQTCIAQILAVLDVLPVDLAALKESVAGKLVKKLSGKPEAPDGPLIYNMCIRISDCFLYTVIDVKSAASALVLKWKALVNSCVASPGAFSIVF